MLAGGLGHHTDNHLIITSASLLGLSRLLQELILVRDHEYRSCLPKLMWNVWTGAFPRSALSVTIFMMYVFKLSRGGKLDLIQFFTCVSTRGVKLIGAYMVSRFASLNWKHHALQALQCCVPTIGATLLVTIQDSFQ